MSLTDSTTKTIYAGDANGGTNTVGQKFPIIMALPYGSTGDDVYGYVIDNLGVSTLLTSNYSVDVNALTFTYPTVGAVAPLLAGVNALPVGWQLVIARKEPLSQTLTLTNSGVLDLPSIERAFDRVVMLCQQLQEQINRATLVAINQPDPAQTVLAPSGNNSVLNQGQKTLAALVVLSNASPTIFMMGTATDVGSQLVVYPGYASTSGINGTGWYALSGGQ